MSKVNWSYSKYFNARTGREGTLFQGGFWSKPIADDAQLIATVYYVHMNPETAGIAPMREYHWSSYQEYAGTHWVVDTSVLLGYFGSFEAFDAYEGSPRDVVWDATRLDNDTRLQDEDALALAMRLAGVENLQRASSGINCPKRDGDYPSYEQPRSEWQDTKQGTWGLALTVRASCDGIEFPGNGRRLVPGNGIPLPGV